MTQTPAGDGRPDRRRIGMLAGAVGAVALAAVVAGAVFGSLVGAGSGESAEPEQTAAPQPEPTEEPAARPAPSDAGSPTPAGSLPADCADIYSAGMLQTLQSFDLPLNDDTVQNVVGTKDEQLGELIRARPTLKCSWGPAGEYGLTTNVTAIESGDAADLAARFDELGFQCGADAVAGTRCSQQLPGGAFGGETHVFTDTTWIGTSWANFGPEGYTSDIVQTLLGPPALPEQDAETPAGP